MADLVSKCLILLKVDEKMLLEVFKVLLLYLCNVLLDIWKWICDVFFAPCSGIQKDINNGLLLDKHLICLVLDSVRNGGCLSVIHSMRRWLPIVLHWRPVRIANKDATSIGCLHRIP